MSGELSKETFLAVLKGAPMSVLFGLWIHGPMTRKKIAIKTKYVPATVDNALEFLLDLGLVERPHYRKWQVSSGFFNLPLPFAEAPKNGASASYPQEIVDHDSQSYPQAEAPKNRASAREAPKNIASAPLVVSSSNTLLTSEAQPLQPDPRILSCCDEVGIYGVKRGQLAVMPHVIAGGADFVRGHVDTSPNIQIAIYRITNDWRLPKTEKSKDLADQVPEEYRDIVIR